MVVKEEIIVRIRAITAGFNKKMGSLKENVAGFNNVMAQSTEQLKKNIVPMNGMVNRGAMFANKMRLMTHGLRGFRMEMLGVMFFGMAMGRLFSSMLRPIAEVFGVFELWTATLQILFLPLMETLFPFLLGLMEFFMNLPEGVKMAIGVFAAFGMVLGKLLMVVGMVALGLGSLFQTTSFAAVIEAIIGSIVKLIGFLTGPFLAVIAVVIAIFAGMFLAWKQNFAKMKDWTKLFINSVKQMFSGLISFIKGIMQVFTGLLTGDFEKVKEGIKNIFKGLFDFVWGSIKALLNGLVMLGIGAFKVLKGIVDVVVNAIIWVWNKIKAIISAAKGLPFFGGGNLPALGNISAPVGAGFNNPINFTSNISINVSDKEEMSRMIDDNNKQVVDDLARMVKQ